MTEAATPDPQASASHPSADSPASPASPLPPPPAPPPAVAARRRLPLRLWLLLGAFAAALAAFLVVLFGRQQRPGHTRAIGARLELAAGEVTVHEFDADQKAPSGTPLAIGAHIRTGKGSRALVRTGDGAALFLRGETEIVLESGGFSLESGEVWLDAPRVEQGAIQGRLGQDTVSASAAGLSIQRTGADATVYVARGLAILATPGGRAEIGAGEQGTSATGAAPKVAPVAFWEDWTGGMGDASAGHGAIGSASGRIYGIDPSAPPGTPSHKLGIAKQIVHAVLRDGIAETEVDQTFSNPGGQAIEGWYWFTVPPTATVTSFALETNGQLVEGEVVERREAAARYQQAVRQAWDPALLEWVDGRSYRARIFPIPASGTRRVVLRYTELLPSVEGKTRYVYPLRSDDPTRFDEFAMSVDLGSAGPDMTVATSLDATLEPGSKMVTMRRSGYLPQADFQLELTPNRPQPPVRAWRFAAGADQADYVMLRYVPDRDGQFATLPPARGDLVVVVDTSAGGDEGARAQRAAAAEAVLRALSDQDHFALVALDVAPVVVYPAAGLAPATDGDIAQALEKLAERGMSGASDIGSMFEPALERLHGTEQPAIVYVGDGRPTSGETTADALMDRMRRSLSGSRARFFAVGVGTEARHELLEELTRAGGGQYLRIDEADETTGQALRLTSAIKTPTVTDLDVDLGAGLDQPFYSATGKLSRGEELVLLARTHHAFPDKVVVKGRVGGHDFRSEYPVEMEKDVTTSLVPRLWAAEYVRRLLGSGAGPDDNRSKVLDLGLEYGLLTPYSSILALDSDAAYSRQGIERRTSILRGVRLTSIQSERDEIELGARFAAAVPAVAMGCDARKPSSDVDEHDNGGGTGTRAKGEQGSMGNPNVRPAEVPEPSPSPVAIDLTKAGDTTSDDKELDQAQSFGLLGHVGAGQGGLQPAATATAHAQQPPRLARPASANDPLSEEAEKMRNAQVGALGLIGDGSGAAAHKDAREAKGGRKGPAQATTTPPPAPPSPPPVADRTYRRFLATCSDAASRPLAERIVLWQRRLRRASQAGDLATQWDAARSSCELPDWRDQAALLDQLQARVDSEVAAQTLLAHFAGDVEAQRYLARAVLRRTSDPRLAAAVSRALFGERIDWAKVDRELLDIKSPDDRITHLKAAMLVAPGDPQGDVRLVRLLAQNGERQEAVEHGRRLRDRGLLTPALAQALGDVLVEAGDTDEALRTYSEVVEFDASSPASRRLLGDIYLRNGWYAAAYRQYKTLTDLDPRNALAWLRLASGAAGAGRVDEALRIEREVRTGEGNPGPDDPRDWARLSSAARLGTLLGDPTAAGAGDTKEAIQRKLKELGLFSGPGTLAIVTWQDFDARVTLGAADPKKENLAGEATNAGGAGLYAVLVGAGAWQKGAWVVRWASDASPRPLKFRVIRLTWDGKSFAVDVKDGELARDARSVGV